MEGSNETNLLVCKGSVKRVSELIRCWNTQVSEQWVSDFMKRNSVLSLRNLQTTSLDRVTDCNRPAVEPLYKIQ
jgi:hypothetical protein